METLQTDLCIIGAGPGGYVAAIYAAKKGLDVVLIDKAKIGGTCLNDGCIPTKALVKSAELYQNVLHSETSGIHVENPSFDMSEVIDHKDEVKDKLIKGIIYLLDKYNVKQIHGVASFQEDNSILVEGDEKYKVEAKDIIIATGSVPKHLPIPGIDSDYVVNSKWLLKNKDLPKRLVVIGGGVIGMEFAFIYASFGVDVTVLEFLPHVLPGVDKEFSQRLMRYAKQLNIDLLSSAKVTKVEEKEDQAVVHYERKDKTHTVTCDLVLEAVGRGPNVSGLGLDNTDIKYSKKDGITVDKHMKTNVDHIYAIGDVTNLWQLAHVASHQGICAVNNILGDECEFDDSAVPSVIFTSPQIATVGKTEQMCKDNKTEYEVIKVPFSANGKALILGAEAGYMKLLQDPKSKQLIGGMVFGDKAEDLIATITVAIQNKLTAKNLQETIFAHPTMSELIHEGAMGLDHQAIHFVD